MSIFGYNPLKLYNGRGAFETMGTGIPMEKGEIAFKCNFAFMDDVTGSVLKRRVSRDFGWGVPLCKTIDGLSIPEYSDYKVACQYATEHRCGIKVSGPGLTSLITGTDPLKDNRQLVKCEAIDMEDPKAVMTADLVNCLSNAIRTALKTHEINTSRASQGLDHTNLILLRGCG
jgi:2,3-bisphosphoglycerate-independent phosphoglycerate mutase